MTERPILFSAEMVRAILDGRKTMTRRIVKPQAAILTDELARSLNVRPPEKENQPVIRCPYGEIWDRLYVRETWRSQTHSFPTGWPYEYKATADRDGVPVDEPWKSPIFMPKSAARIWLEITGVRVERLQEITDEEALLEGCYQDNEWVYSPGELRGRFKKLWQSIHGPESWSLNPYVWVIEFKRIEP